MQLFIIEWADRNGHINTSHVIESCESKAVAFLNRARVVEKINSIQKIDIETPHIF
ncbi:MAG: hypothetical protein Q8O87_03885 [bacterium]|nr:hypothetical protein [bacterium]